MRILLFLRLSSFAGFLAVPVLWAQPASASTAAELAGLREDVRLLQQRIGALALRVEQLEVENGRLTKALAERDSVTLAQLNAAVADLTREFRAADASNRTEILANVGAQLEALARQTNAALDAQAARLRPAAPAATVSSAPAGPTFSDNFPKEGITYTVVAGDTVSRIAQKTGARVADIINANRLTDPTRIQVGQVLFIPGGR